MVDPALHAIVYGHESHPIPDILYAHPGFARLQLALLPPPEPRQLHVRDPPHAPAEYPDGDHAVHVLAPPPHTQLTTGIPQEVIVNPLLAATVLKAFHSVAVRDGIK